METLFEEERNSGNPVIMQEGKNGGNSVLMQIRSCSSGEGEQRNLRSRNTGNSVYMYSILEQ
jgi:hypothetical protein